MSKSTESEIIAEVEKLQILGKDDLRLRWSKMFGKTPPAALTKDLLGRMIAWRIQEKFYGGMTRPHSGCLTGSPVARSPSRPPSRDSGPALSSCGSTGVCGTR
jgi:Protein of unknown function (DUF2924)